jgi:hypothetical protein
VFGDFSLDCDSSESFTAINGGQGPEQFQAATVAQLAQGTKIAFDDGSGDNNVDFEDSSTGAQLVPEPVALLGTLLAIGALGAARSQKKRQRPPEK